MDSRVARATPLDTRAARMTEEEAFQPSRKNLSPLLSPSRSRNRESSVFGLCLCSSRRGRISCGPASSYPAPSHGATSGRLRAWLRPGPDPPKNPPPSVILDISNRGSSVFVVGSCLCFFLFLSSYPLLMQPTDSAMKWRRYRRGGSCPRHPMAPPQGACGHGCAPVPNPIWGRGLSERSEFRSPNLRDRDKGTRRATPGRPWFWVLLPKQKSLS